ncbi:MAG: N-acetyltransferase [Deltaproteobacteria bacterium]|nr:MAG: N-acetyltransferase [Deltaproteobacteria bacterium]
MIVRRARDTDLPAIVDIFNWAVLHTHTTFVVEPVRLESWRQAWRETARDHPWFVAERDAVVCGFARAAPHKGPCAYAWSVDVSAYVHPDHHRQGIATALYTRLLPTLRAQGYRSAIAVIAVPNPASERLHAAFGLRRMGTLAAVGFKAGSWHDVEYWQLQLRPDAAPPEPIRPVAEVCDGAAARSR